MSKFSELTYTPGTDRNSVDMSDVLGAGAVIYARPATVKDHSLVAAKHPGWPQVASNEAMAMMLCRVGETKEGEPFFDYEDRAAILKLNMSDANRLFMVMVEVDEEALEKN